MVGILKLNALVKMERFSLSKDELLQRYYLYQCNDNSCEDGMFGIAGSNTTNNFSKPEC